MAASHTGTAPQRRRRTNHAAEVDGATSSINAKSAPAAIRARSTLNPSAPQSSASSRSSRSAPGPSGKAIRIVGFGGSAEQPVGLRLEGRQAVAERGSGPRRDDRCWNAVEPGLEQGCPGRQIGNAQRGDEPVAIDRLAEQLANLGRVELAAAAQRKQPEQPRCRIEAQASARRLHALGEGQIGEASAEHQVGLAGGETRDRRLGLFALERDLLAGRGFLVAGRDRAGQAQRRAVGARRIGERPAACAAARHRELGLGEQRQQIGARRDQPDLDHPVGHRHHVVDRAERVLQRILAAAGDLPLEQAGDLLRGDLAAIGPFGRSDPEDVAEAVVADVPALGEARDDVAGRIEPDQPLRDILQKHRVGRRERAFGGIAQARLAADDDDLDRAGRLLAAPAGATASARIGSRAQKTPHRCPFSRNASFSKRLDMCGEVF